MAKSSNAPLVIKYLGLCDYHQTWQAMRTFTDARTDKTPDELWLVEHPPVYTLGQRVNFEHVLNSGDIPLVETDRGGQVTYHGPGQQLVYVLIDLKRAQLGIRRLVTLLEQSIINLLTEHYQLSATSRCEAPGVYIADKKICSIGLRVRRGCSYHGLAFNVAMDLAPFKRINPCGYAGLQMAQLRDWHPDIQLSEVQPLLIAALIQQLNNVLRPT
jgi:lipoyl(octanoyl) transferase